MPRFVGAPRSDVFAEKNSKTLRETLWRYKNGCAPAVRPHSEIISASQISSITFGRSCYSVVIRPPGSVPWYRVKSQYPLYTLAPVPSLQSLRSDRKY